MPSSLGGRLFIVVRQADENLAVKITPSFFILSNSALTLGNRSTATRLGVVKAKGYTSLSNCIV